MLTVHRPVNADDPAALEQILFGINDLDLPVVFPMHPRTRARNPAAPAGQYHNIKIIEPVGYLDSLALTHQARLAVTDSGGLQKEALFLGAPCVTLRGETEWTETLELGMNALTGDRPEAARLKQVAIEMLGKHGMKETKSSLERENILKQFFGPSDVANQIIVAVVNYLDSQC